MGNCCSGGIRIPIKRRTSIVLVSPDPSSCNDHPQNCVDLLPIEVWDKILSHLKNNTKDMLTCRLVCKHWKDVADGLFQREIQEWTPLHPFIPSVPLIFMGSTVEAIIRRTRGTRFASCTQLHDFLTQMKGYEGNPFPNRTVLLYPNPDLCLPNTKPHHRLYKKFPILLSRFGEHIWQLEYRVIDDVPASIQILRVINQLPNLKVLTLYTRDWNKRNVRKGLFKLNRKNQNLVLLNSLTHLKIMGSNGILPLNLLFAPLRNQITYLYFCFVDNVARLGWNGRRRMGRIAREIDPQIKQSLTYSLPELMPNLTHLKVDEVNEELINKILPSPGETGGKILGEVKYLSVKLQRSFLEPLNRILQAIDEHFMFTLETLHLEISRWSVHESSSPTNSEAEQAENLPLREKVLKVDPKFQLLKLTELIIPYALYVLEPQFLFKFAEKCPNLRYLTFISVNIHYAEFPDFEGFCKPLWSHLPESLERVTVRYWVDADLKKLKPIKERGVIMTGVMKLFRNPPQRRPPIRKMRPEPTALVLTCDRPKRASLSRRHSWTGAGKETRKL